MVKVLELAFALMVTCCLIAWFWLIGWLTGTYWIEPALFSLILMHVMGYKR
jgi:hypothetical protein